VTRLWAGQLEFDFWWEQGFFLHHHIQTGSGVHAASYPVGTGISLPIGKAARA